MAQRRTGGSADAPQYALTYAGAGAGLAVVAVPLVLALYHPSEQFAGIGLAFALVAGLLVGAPLGTAVALTLGHAHAARQTAAVVAALAVVAILLSVLCAQLLESLTTSSGGAFAVMTLPVALVPWAARRLAMRN